MPEKQTVELDLTVKEDSSIGQLRQATLELVQQQKLILQAGVMNAQQVAHSKVLATGSVVDVQAKEISP
jgi:hypothetical protein